MLRSMVMFGYLFVVLVCSLIVGIIVLEAVPAFRVTGWNVFLFVFGAIVGALALTNLVLRWLDLLDNIRGVIRPASDALAYLTYGLMFFGGVIGGTISVWIQYRSDRKVGQGELPKRASPKK
jgi:prolipoprotein diacylglyceryltransferase